MQLLTSDDQCPACSQAAIAVLQHTLPRLYAKHHIIWYGKSQFFQ